MTLRVLALLGLIALGFAAGSFYTSSSFGLFGWANAIAGAVALATAAGLWLRRAPGLASPAERRVIARPLLGVLVALVLVVGVERLAEHADWRYDASADARYTISPATRAALAALPEAVTTTLYGDTGDPRLRSTRLLLDTLAGAGPVVVRERDLDQSPRDVDRYGISASNSVVLTLGERAELVSRPTEGSLYEGLRHLIGEHGQVVAVARGEGEGDIQRSDDAGFGGLAAALATEGFVVRDLVTAAMTAVPGDVSVLLLIAPERPLRDTALAAIERWLERGGRLVVMLEPGSDSGIEGVLERWGFELPDALIVDPASGPVEGDPAGVNPVVHSFATHPITKGLDSTRMVFFRRARPVLAARKPEGDDELRALALSSRRAWLAPNAGAVQRGAAPERPDELREDYWPILAVGRYPRTLRGAAGEEGEIETRIAVFGDAEFASNRYLRSLYNMDLLLNTIQWAAQREDAITLRPKALTPDQYPLTPQQSLDMLYGIGLLVPELCLAAAAFTWVRRRSG